MRALVTGASGFIGGNLVRELVKQGHQVKALVRKESNKDSLQDLKVEFSPGDLLDGESLERAMQDCDVLFHAAAMYTFWSADPHLIVGTNVEGTRNILQTAKKHGIKKVVFTSSESTVGIDNKSGLGKESMQASLKHIPGDYKKSKYLAEEIARQMCLEGLPVVIVNPTTPIGPYDVKPTPTGKIITDYLNGKMFACVNTGLNVVDVEDVARGHILAMEKGRPGERYLLGNQNLTLRGMMSILEKVSGVKASRLNIPIWFALCAGYADQLVEGSLMRRYPHIPVSAVKASSHFRHFDCSKAIKELRLPQSSIESAFEKSVKWFRDNGYVKRAR
jgi:dihydroflavonol-4-reductase